MKCRVELHNAAQKELTEAFQWYEKRSPVWVQDLLMQ